MGQVETGGLDELALGAQPFEEHHQLQLEEDHRVDGGAPPVSVALPRPLPDEGQVERGLEVPVEMIPGHQVVQRHGDRFVQAAGLGRAEHGELRGEQSAAEPASLSSLGKRSPAVFFNGLGGYGNRGRYDGRRDGNRMGAVERRRR